LVENGPFLPISPLFGAPAGVGVTVTRWDFADIFFFLRKLKSPDGQTHDDSIYRASIASRGKTQDKMSQSTKQSYTLLKCIMEWNGMYFK